MGCTASIGRAKIIRNKSDIAKKHRHNGKNLSKLMRKCEKTTDFTVAEKNLFKISEVDQDFEESGMISYSYHKISTKCLNIENIQQDPCIKAKNRFFDKTQEKYFSQKVLTSTVVYINAFQQQYK